MLFTISLEMPPALPSLGSALIFVAANFPVAAADVPFLPAIAIQMVEPPDPAAYATCVAEVNGARKARHGVPLFLRVYAGEATSEDGPMILALNPANSFAALQTNSKAWIADVELAELRARLAALEVAHTRTLLQALRFDGTHAPG